MRIGPDVLFIALAVLLLSYPAAQKRLPPRLQSAVVSFCGLLLLALGLTDLYWPAIGIGLGCALLGLFLFRRESQGRPL